LTLTRSSPAAIILRFANRTMSVCLLACPRAKLAARVLNCDISHARGSARNATRRDFSSRHNAQRHGSIVREPPRDRQANPPTPPPTCPPPVQRDNRSTAIFHAIISSKLTAAARTGGRAGGERSRGMPECDPRPSRKEGGGHIVAWDKKRARREEGRERGEQRWEGGGSWGRLANGIRDRKNGPRSRMNLWGT
jgi:hypothetical protein